MSAPRYRVEAHVDRRAGLVFQVIDRQSHARRCPRIYQTYQTADTARRCADALNALPPTIAHYAGDISHGIGINDWVTTDIRRVTCQTCLDYVQTRIERLAPRATTTEGKQS